MRKPGSRENRWFFQSSKVLSSCPEERDWDPGLQTPWTSGSSPWKFLYPCYDLSEAWFPNLDADQTWPAEPLLSPYKRSAQLSWQNLAVRDDVVAEQLTILQCCNSRNISSRISFNHLIWQFDFYRCKLTADSQWIKPNQRMGFWSGLILVSKCSTLTWLLGCYLSSSWQIFSYHIW